MTALKDSAGKFYFAEAKKYAEKVNGFGLKNDAHFKKWKVKTANGGGPVLLQKGEVTVSNNEELKIAGKEISDKHPRTCMGYTKKAN